MGTWIYNNDILQKHPMAQFCLSSLNKVSNDDYPGTNYFDAEIECLDMDPYEQSRKGISGKTVDAVIGISDCDNKRVINPRLLCVELRMGYKSTHNFSKDFADKVTYSRGLLGGHITIESKSLFVFSDALAAQAKSWIKNRARSGGVYKNMDSCGVSSFGNIIKSLKDMPYKSINDEHLIREKLAEFELCKDWSSFIKEFERLCLLALKYQFTHTCEYDFMVNLLKELWSEFRLKYSHLKNENDELNAEILEESFFFLVE